MDFQSAMDTFVEAWMAANTKTDQVQIAEPSFGIDTQGLATFEAEQCVLVTEEPSVSPVPTVSAAECYATSACASSSIADTPKHTPDTVFRAQSTLQAGGEHEPETGGVRSQQIYLEHGEKSSGPLRGRDHTQHRRDTREQLT